MSLQAKIEAVIYASEEPVTLAQLMGLLGEEAQAELDALDAQQGSLSLGLEEPLQDSEEPAGEAPGDQDALNAEVLEDAELEREPQAGEADEIPAAAGEAGSSSVLRGDSQEEVSVTLPDAEISVEEDVPGSKSQSRDAEPTTSTTHESSPEPPEDASVITEHGAATQVVEAAPAALEETGREALSPESAPADNKRATREKERRLRDYFRSLMDRLIADYANSDRGLEVREVAGGFRMATKPEYHDAVRGFVKSLKPPLKLSLQALETLAVIAYKQPVTAPEITEIRGVESGGVLGTLVARKLIGTAGRKAVIGRPMLYKTTKEFLVRFGLKDINELPSIEEFEKMAGELNEPVQEEIPMNEVANRTSQETPEGGSPSLDELNSAPGNSDVAESAAEAVGPRDSGAEGSQTEPSSGVSQEAAASVERSRDVHEAQADGVPDENATPTDARTIDEHEPYTGSDETGA